MFEFIYRVINTIKKQTQNGNYDEIILFSLFLKVMNYDDLSKTNTNAE